MNRSIKTGIIAVAIIAFGMPVFFFTPTTNAQQDVNPVVPTETNNETVTEPATVLPSTAEIQNGLCAGANLDVTTNCQSGISGQDATDKINDLIADVINIFSLVVGVVSVFMIIIGGFKYITSGGDSNNVASAKNTILYAIIGLVIVALAQTIVRFILGRVVSA